MAFIQQGPRRSTRNSAAAPRGHEAPATLSASIATTDRDADWSIVFPGRVKDESNARKQSSSPHQGQDEGEDDQPTAVQRSTIARAASSATLAPLHDGTGSFGDVDAGAPSSSRVETFESALLLDDDAQSDLYFENDEDAESSATPPSLGTSSAREQSSSSVTRSRSRNFSHSSSAALSSPPFDQREFFGGDSNALSPEWSWQEDGNSRVLASSSAITDRSNRPVFFDSDSENDDAGPAYRQQGKASSPQDDSRYEADLAAAPFAISAGLHPRRPRRLQSSTATSEISGSQASAGFKRRHRRQHLADDDKGSVRSSKSRRSESYCGSNAPIVSRKKASSSSSSSRRVAPAQSAAPPPNSSLSKRQKATRLLARLFDVDNDVLDCVLEDQGPLAVSQEEQERASQMHRPWQAGFDHEREYPAPAAGFRELIDGRIVEDIDGEQKEIEATHNPILELATADWSNVQLPTSNDPLSSDEHHLSNPTLQGAIRHAFLHLCGPSSGGEGPTTTSSVILSSTVEALQGAMPYFVPFSWRLLMRVMKEWNGSNQTGADALSIEDQNVKGKDQQSEEQVLHRRQRQASIASTTGTASLTHNEVASLEDSTSGKTSSDKVEEWRERSSSTASLMTTTSSRMRGRARERRAVAGAEESTWTLATSSGE
ncbi:hypothetical protein BDZ90DRAFT_230423 [Jaminaea rosea]|uniref:Uncharacterized protein n=1 Tax=Jaminaea rosea TaxID=1569628 RepID=A0A316V2A5_9BASI|nr:hypothetical protein BDZ90DRAFT_230423 [Jaminaea rosea]PWN29555.1 hypothetical protein BDZ90DRAFT_230423 [Jaminaea rosea]